MNRSVWFERLKIGMIGIDSHHEPPKMTAIAWYRSSYLIDNSNHRIPFITDACSPWQTVGSWSLRSSADPPVVTRHSAQRAVPCAAASPRQ